MGKRISGIIITVIFLFALILPVVTMNHQSGKISAAENRYLADFPQIFDNSGHLAANLRSGLIQWFNDNLGFREELIRMSSSLQYRVLRRSPSEKVEIGSDGWFFYTMDNNLDIARENYPNFDADVLETICEQQMAIQDKLRQQGSEYVLILPPSKVSVYPEYIQSGNYSLTRTPADILADYLEEHSDLKVVRVKDALIEAKGSRQLYFRTDTHWNEYGAYVGYSKIIYDMNEWGLLSSTPADAYFETGYYQGEFSGMMGNPEMLEPEPCPKSVIANPHAQRAEEGERVEAIRTLLNIYAPHALCYHYENRDIPAPRVVMFGDSMFGSWSATELLAENFSELTYIWDRTIRQEYLDLLSPDVVLYEIGERYLNTLSAQNTLFLQNNLREFSSYISSFEWEDYLLRVTVENTSGETWRESDQVKLGLFSGGQDTGIRALLSIGQEVHPGESAVFEISLVEHPDLLSQPLEVGMLQEGIAYFPGRKAVWPENLAKQTTDIPSNDVNYETANLLDIPYHEMVTEEEYGQWMGKQGICLDTCNDRNLGNGDLTVIAGESFLNIVGWGADFNAEAPFRELYLKVGENVVRCNYGIDRQSVVDHFQKETLRNTGFEVTIPASFITDGVTEISFIGVSADGTALYEPVVYQIRR